MDIRIIINSIILIFILHIIILNINYTIDIGNKNKIENFDNENNKENSMNFLMGNNNDSSNEEFKKKLLKYIQVNEPVKENAFEKKNTLSVEASNSFVSSDNVPNFESNVADISKFYKVNYDNLNEDELKSTSIEKLQSVNSKEQNNITIDPQSKESCNVKSYGRESTVVPDTWTYKNELPMNGGQMNGIIGFDNLESQFAIFNPNKLNLQSSNNPNLKNIAHDDLRKPIVYEN
jgi:hypothetical protein